MIRNDRFISIIEYLITGMLLLTSLGCATRPRRSEPVFFPPPPSEPRLQYLTSFSSSDDIRKPNRLLEFLVGRLPAEQIDKPYGLAIHDGKIFVCDTRRAVVWILDLKDRRMGVFLPSGVRMARPINITIDTDGTTYLTDTIRGQVIICTPEGKCIDVIGTKDETKPIDVAVTADRFFVADMKTRTVRIHDKNSRELLATIPKTKVHDEKLFSPTSVAVDSKGAIYVSDVQGFHVQKYSAEGKYLQTFGTHGSGPGQFARPKGIALDRDDRLYAVDAAAQVVQVFAPTGQLLTYFGYPGETPIGLSLPSQIIVDYDNVDYFREHAAEGFEIEYLVLVASQHGVRKIDVFGFGQMKE